MDYETFKKDCSELYVFEFMDKWRNDKKYEEFEQRKYDEDFYEYVCEYYDYNKSEIRKWKIFKNTCELYVDLLNKNN